MINIPVTLKQIKSSKSNKFYIALHADLGYCVKTLAFGRDALEICDVSSRDVSRETEYTIANGYLQIVED